MSKTIMVVDDSCCVRQMVSFIIKNSGYEVVEAEDGLDALAKLDSCPSLSLIVTDLHMPRLDGIGLIKSVRNNSDHRLVPIITIESEESNESEGHGSGGTESIPKPFRPEQLIDAITRALDDDKESRP